MDALAAIATRSTFPPAKMARAGGPDDAQLRAILEAGAAAPDHGRLRPWRFLVVRGEARERLGALFADSLRARDAGVSEGELEKQRTAPLRAPVIVVVLAKVRKDHPKAPPVEQIGSAAAAAQNILLAAHAMGFAGKWATGKNAYDPRVRAGLGLDDDDVVTGFLFLGSPAASQAPTERPPVDDVVVEWTGEGAR